jgi:hypothetical protein
LKSINIIIKLDLIIIKINYVKIIVEIGFLTVLVSSHFANLAVAVLNAPSSLIASEKNKLSNKINNVKKFKLFYN